MDIEKLLPKHRLSASLNWKFLRKFPVVSAAEFIVPKNFLISLLEILNKRVEHQVSRDLEFVPKASGHALQWSKVTNVR